MKLSPGFGILLLSAMVACNSAVSQATLITTNDIRDLNTLGAVVGSGSGTLDLVLFTGSTAENTSGGFNFDDGNTSLASGGSGDSLGFSESYVLSGADLKGFYTLNTITEVENPEIALILDLNESVKPTNTLTKLEIVINPTTWGTLSPNPVGNDVSSPEQAAIDQAYTGGTLTELNILSLNLPESASGSGFADYAVLTGINPFLLNDADVILFNISMSDLSNGAEQWFISGEFASGDLVGATPVPEPSALMLTMMLGVGCVARRKRRSTRA